MTDYILKAQALTRDYTSGNAVTGRKVNRALNGVNIALERGRTLAVVGESGCGKSTLARILTMIDPQTSGDLTICGEKVDLKTGKPSADLRRKVQIVFQNPYSSLNPRQKILNVLTEQLYLNTKDKPSERREKAMAMLKRVGLSHEVADRYPHMLSGGMRQRVVIARSLMINPEILVLDEPVSALDLSVQAQVLNLLRDLQDEFGLSYLFISHDLSVVRFLADQLVVMNKGQIVEEGAASDIFASPQHEYTRKLFAATPSADIAAIRTRMSARTAALNGN